MDLIATEIKYRNNLTDRRTVLGESNYTNELDLMKKKTPQILAYCWTSNISSNHCTLIHYIIAIYQYNIFKNILYKFIVGK